MKYSHHQKIHREVGRTKDLSAPRYNARIEQYKTRIGLCRRKSKRQFLPFLGYIDINYLTIS